jgi:hypothetical protein
MSTFAPAEGTPVAWSQASVAAGTATTTARAFPPRRTYRHGHGLEHRYDQFADQSTLVLDLSSNNFLQLMFKPVVDLTLEASYRGATPQAPPESVVITARIYRLRVELGGEQSTAAVALAIATALANADTARRSRATALGATASAPMLYFVVRGTGHPEGASGTVSQMWRAELGAPTAGSRVVVSVDSGGIHFLGRKWLSGIVNIIDGWKKPNELSALVYARGDSGQLSFDHLPGNLRQVLSNGMSIRLTEETHQSSIPLTTLLELASAPNAVMGRLTTVEFPIGGAELEALKDFASRLAPSDSAALASAAPPPPAPNSVPVPERGGAPRSELPADTGAGRPSAGQSAPLRPTAALAVPEFDARQARQPTSEMAGRQASQAPSAADLKPVDSVLRARQKLFSEMSRILADASRNGSRMQMADLEEDTPKQRNPAPATRAEGGGSTRMLRQIYQEAVPRTIDEDSDHRIDLVGGTLALRPDMTFALRLDLRVQRQGAASNAVWQTSGRYRQIGVDQLEFGSPDFPDYSEARGLLNRIAADDPPAVEGRLRPGRALIMTFKFAFAGITFGPDPYTFQ